jgi:hypothetical protein
MMHPQRGIIKSTERLKVARNLQLSTTFEIGYYCFMNKFIFDYIFSDKLLQALKFSQR